CPRTSVHDVPGLYRERVGVRGNFRQCTEGKPGDIEAVKHFRKDQVYGQEMDSWRGFDDRAESSLPRVLIGC
ncbi:hypothetical protein, partial [Serratia fonticola]|uniref:hypothetical protein n=1 Tax=Serratia fonticola TaxID=47917 RepID=UPI001C0F18DC